MLELAQRIAGWLRARRWAHLGVVNLRILVGFAFVPAGLKKVLGEPFTDPANTGAFHEFLHAFYATGGFYRFVGVVQLVAAVLLMTQRFATVGAALGLPVVTAIWALCISTAGLPTTTVVSLMWLALVGLLLWDVGAWRQMFAPDGAAATSPPRHAARPMVSAAAEGAALIDRRLWSQAGACILLLYGASCVLSGGIYRPRGAEFDNPGFYILPSVALVPVVTWWLDRRRYLGRAAAAGARPHRGGRGQGGLL